MEVIPAILESTWPEVEKKIRLVEGLTDWIQLDVSDGIFTPVKTWDNPSDLLGLELKSKIEVHLMIENPLAVLNSWFANPVDRIVIHVESLNNGKHPMFAMFARDDKEIVLGFNVETPWEQYQELIKQVGRVLFLSVSPGYQGQEFNERVFAKIKTLKLAMPQIKIEVDGGINISNISELKSLGVDIAVVGSAIFESADLKQTLKTLMDASV